MNFKTTTDQYLSGQCLLITGAGFDIGKALALRCAKLGADLILMDNNKRALNALYDEIEALGLTLPTILHLNSRKLDTQTGALLCQQILDQHDKLDALIHTADAAFALSPIELIEDEWLDKSLQALHTLPHRITREFLPALKIAINPSIIFTSHFSAQTHDAYWGCHASAFAALEALSRQWATGTKQLGFSVNSIDPGIVNTQIRKKHFPAQDFTQLTQPDDDGVMQLYLNLLSETGKQSSGEHYIR